MRGSPRSIEALGKSMTTIREATTHRLENVSNLLDNPQRLHDRRHTAAIPFE